MIKVGIVGTGNIFGAHVDGYRAFPDRCSVVAVADTFPDRAREKVAKTGLDAAVYDSLDALLENEAVQLVSICTPPFTHRELAVKSLAAGVNVLLEKPMASSLEECDAIMDAVEKSGAKLSVVAQNRFRTPVWNMKKILQEGLIGKLLHTQINSYWWRGLPYYDLWWRGTWEKEGGGCTLNHAVHHIDMMLWLTGMPQDIAAMMGNVAHDNSEVEDLSMAIMRFADNSFAQVTSSVVHHGEKQEMILQGTESRISAPLEAAASLTAPNGFPERNGALEEKILQRYKDLGDLSHQGHEGQIGDMLEAIEEDRQPLVAGRDGRNAIELIMGIYKASTESRMVRLPLSSQDSFYRVPGILEHAPRFNKKKNSVLDQGSYGITLGSAFTKEK